MHEKGIVHRDLKPGINVLISNNYCRKHSHLRKIKLIDR
jgi:serine/threonine protein kinase